MVSEMQKMPESARLWVYQSNRSFDETEIALIRKATEKFLETWAAHGSELTASYEIRFDQFLILAVDESRAGASGCSIDASVSFIRQLESQLNVSFLDRSKIAYLNDDHVFLTSLNQLKEKVTDGSIRTDTKIINNSVATYGDWKRSWIQPAADSWMARYFR